jgi:hypothetical protein
VLVPSYVGTHGEDYNGCVTNTSAPLAALYSASYPLAIGCSQSGAQSGPYNEPFNGSIDDVRLYSIALTPSEVQAVFYAGITPANYPQITSFDGTALSSGQFTLNFTGPDSYPYRIWSTTNLALGPVQSTWTLVTSGTLASGVNTYTDTAATDMTEFYTITVP